MDNKKKRGVPAGTVILLAVLAAGVSACGCYYLGLKEKYAGSAAAYSRELVKNLDENSFDYKIVKTFYTEDQLANIRNNTVAVTEETEPDDAADTSVPDVEIVPVYGSTYEGYLMKVHNPKDISVAVNPNLGASGAAPELEDYVAQFQAKGGINGGGFADSGGTGDGSIPQGIVIHNGQLVYGYGSEYESIIGIDQDGKLLCVNATADDALSWGIQEAVTFGPVFINNYEVVFPDNYTDLANLNPRTAIGQSSDGTFLLLVVDGRGPTSFGAYYTDLIQIFQANDAVMAANLDGGNSSAMEWNGEYVNNPVSLYGSRSLPTVFLVKGDN